jgi:UDPglucose 6-dehydrogenase
MYGNLQERGQENKMTIGIIGYGVVGKHLHNLFDAAGQKTVIYDKYKPGFDDATRRNEINRCDLVFVAVPTPAQCNGECDISEVAEATSWIEPPICIKSTVEPGTTEKLIAATGKRIVFSPEYIGETPFHKSREFASPDLIAIGGDRAVSELFADAYRLALGPEPRYFLTDSLTAELAKYMENCFFATKVAFVAQFYMLAKHLNADFTQMREIWVADSRVGRSHSTVVGDPGFGGRCLPKDLSALVALGHKVGLPLDLLEAVQEFNVNTCGRSAAPFQSTVGRER